MKSYFDADLGISLEMPDDWEAGQSEAFPLVLLAPYRDDKLGGYRSNLGFDANPISVPDPERLEEILEQTKADQRRDYPNFEQTEEVRFRIDSRPAYWQRYTWQPHSNPRQYAQVFGLIVAGPERLIDFHGATLVETAGEFMPLFRKIIASIRLINHPDES